jgi:hypothetical protein
MKITQVARAQLKVPFKFGPARELTRLDIQLKEVTELSYYQSFLRVVYRRTEYMIPVSNVAGMVFE